MTILMIIIVTKPMTAEADAASVALRPHVKTHKSAKIAGMQLAAGARHGVSIGVGMTA